MFCDGENLLPPNCTETCLETEIEINRVCEPCNEDCYSCEETTEKCNACKEGKFLYE